jgi:hypothetical protein
MVLKTIFPRPAYFLVKGTYLKGVKTIASHQPIIILKRMIIWLSSLLSSNALRKRISR